MIGAIIKLTSPGPVFFTQLREGKGGRRFRMYKLRSMCVDAHKSQAAAAGLQRAGRSGVQDGARSADDVDRPTLATDEPRRDCRSLWNVLLGDMSLVGPRPLPVDESLQCKPWQRRRLAVLPGLTCVWQVRGRSTVTFEEWMRMDLEYLRDRSFSYDMPLDAVDHSDVGFEARAALAATPSDILPFDKSGHNHFPPGFLIVDTISSQPNTDWFCQQPTRLRAAALWAACRTAEACSLSRGNRWDDGFAILMYHRVAEEVPGVESPTMNVTPEQLRRQLSGLLALGYESWPLSKLVAGPTRRSRDPFERVRRHVRRRL